VTADKNISSADTPATAMGAPRVLIAAGGTGGHVYPGIAIADAVREMRPDAAILFVGTRDRMEWQAVPRAGYAIKSIWISGFHRRLTLRNLLFPLKLTVSLFQSLQIIRAFNPDVVISCGGFASGPVGRVAASLGIPLLLQEQNSYPGVTTRMLSSHARIIFTAFEDAVNRLPPEKVNLAGNPVRSSIGTVNRAEGLEQFGFSDDRPVLLVLGGSGGARTVNDAVEKNLASLHDQQGVQIIWQCGKRYFDDLQERIDSDSWPRLRLMEFIEQMPAAYAAADLVVSRAGAISCSELMMAGKAALLIPSPNVAGDHQTKNADSMVSRGAARMLPDSQAVDQLADYTAELIDDPELLKEMGQKAAAMARPDAARVIAREIETIRSVAS